METKLQIADIVVGVTCPAQVSWSLQDSGLRRSPASGSPSVVVTVRASEPPLDALGDEERVFSTSDGVRSICLDEHRWQLELHPRCCALPSGCLSHQLLTFDRRFTVGDLYVIQDHISGSPVFSFRAVLSDLLPNMLPFHGGIMLHAAGVSEGGQAVLFAGSSGAGKSTLAALWQRYEDAKVLNDDRIIVTRRDGQFWAYPGVGFGDVCSPPSAGAVLKQVHFLSHGRKNAAKRRHPSGAGSALVAHALLPPYHARAIRLALQLLEELVDEVPLYELSFVPDGTVVDFIRGID